EEEDEPPLLPQAARISSTDRVGSFTARDATMVASPRCGSCSRSCSACARAAGSSRRSSSTRRRSISRSRHAPARARCRRTRRPTVRAALAGFVAGVGADPAVGAAADKLVTRLATDTPLAEAGEQLLTRLQQLPAVQELVRTHPELAPEQLGASVTRKLAATFR